MRSEPSLARSRTRGQRTATGPMPVMISRSGRCPWRTSRWRPSSVSLSAWLASKTATSASTACPSSARAPLRRTSVSGSAKVPGWQSWKTLALVTAYHSFGGEVEASSTPTIRRLTPSCRHQLSLIAPDQVLGLLIREIVERLQHHDLELQDRIVGLATSVALALLGLRLGHALDVSAEVLPPHDLLDRFQRIAFGADRLKPALNIEKARLPHDSLARSAHGPLRSASQIRSDLARRIFRGALKSQRPLAWARGSRPPPSPFHTYTRRCGSCRNCGCRGGCRRGERDAPALRHEYAFGLAARLNGRLVGAPVVIALPGCLLLRDRGLRQSQQSHHCHEHSEGWFHHAHLRETPPDGHGPRPQRPREGNCRVGSRNVVRSP